MELERVIPVHVIEGLLSLNRKYIVTTSKLEADEDSTTTFLALGMIGVAWKKNVANRARSQVYRMQLYLQSQGYSPKESGELVDKVVQYNEIGIEFDRHRFWVGLVMLILSILGTIGLTWVNCLVHSKGIDNMFLIVMNVVVFCCIFLSIRVMDRKVLKRCELFFKRNKACDEDSLLNDKREYAYYLMKEHNYTKEALLFAMSDFDEDYVNLKLFVDQL
ncbi:MAG: hypothetical protein J6X70_06660 [Muribaculaceae bacterium]|nr:hypothetical protein [Muribaculaceae bacterium]